MRITGEGSDATADAWLHEILRFFPIGPGSYTVAPEHVRGGFRYLSLIHNATGGIDIEQVSVHFTAIPPYVDDALQDYS